MWGLLPLSAPTRRGLRAAASITAALLLLTACAGDQEPEDPAVDDGEQTTENDDAADDDAVDDGGEGEGADGPLPEVSAEFGAGAEMEFTDGPGLDGLQVEVLDEGSGDPVDEMAPVLAHYAGHVWGQDEPFDSSFERGAPTLFPLTSVVQGWAEGIPGHPVGSRLLISIPPEYGYGDQGNPDAGIGGQDTIVFVVDIIDAVGNDDAGDPEASVVTEADDLPVTIDGDLGEPAEVTVRDDADEPDEPTVEVIAEGDGDAVAPGTQVVVAYSLVTWSNEERESTWAAHGGEQAGPELHPIGQGQWVDLLVDADVPEGSRVLLTLPGSEEAPGVAVLADVLLVHAG